MTYFLIANDFLKKTKYRIEAWNDEARDIDIKLSSASVMANSINSEVVKARFAEMQSIEANMEELLFKLKQINQMIPYNIHSYQIIKFLKAFISTKKYEFILKNTRKKWERIRKILLKNKSANDFIFESCQRKIVALDEFLKNNRYRIHISLDSLDSKLTDFEEKLKSLWAESSLGNKSIRKRINFYDSLIEYDSDIRKLIFYEFLKLNIIPKLIDEIENAINLAKKNKIPSFLEGDYYTKICEADEELEAWMENIDVTKSQKEIEIIFNAYKQFKNTLGKYNQTFIIIMTKFKQVIRFFKKVEDKLKTISINIRELESKYNENVSSFDQEVERIKVIYSDIKKLNLAINVNGVLDDIELIKNSEDEVPLEKIPHLISLMKNFHNFQKVVKLISNLAHTSNLLHAQLFKETRKYEYLKSRYLFQVEFFEWIISYVLERGFVLDDAAKKQKEIIVNLGIKINKKDNKIQIIKKQISNLDDIEQNKEKVDILLEEYKKLRAEKYKAQWEYNNLVGEFFKSIWVKIETFNMLKLLEREYEYTRVKHKEINDAYRISRIQAESGNYKIALENLIIKIRKKIQ
ncbi:hypothetical protein EI74_0564 [Mycoplasma testudineum]|uniref:Uncharacterized protein n=1 Tax=Mycoplasma testudineum TaxID=244584 RepID=A0A4R6IDC4_9MOLU|nr:hypothetical protein [Mycoplasma testudineum]OYD26788.1 hypothetical protein CG473_02430 [Mycoplasma testudineum]TDO19924.1 hypothetical protein EI74_0564 [Mycoplasma testudineum]